MFSIVILYNVSTNVNVDLLAPDMPYACLREELDTQDSKVYSNFDIR
jgi:hypothetical protein